MWKVKIGGIKKKFHINALKKAATNTGKMSNNMATIETVTRSNKATVLYPINGEPKKQAIEVKKTSAILIRYWFRMLYFLVCNKFNLILRLISKVII
jgi:hypothetical protein